MRSSASAWILARMSSFSSRIFSFSISIFAVSMAVSALILASSLIAAAFSLLLELQLDLLLHLSSANWLWYWASCHWHPSSTLHCPPKKEVLESSLGRGFHTPCSSDTEKALTWKDTMPMPPAVTLAANSEWGASPPAHRPQIPQGAP